MISPKPNTDPWHVLALVVAHPGELDAESIGQAIWRPKIRSSDDVLRVRAAVLTDGEAWTQKASAILGELVRAGHVEKMRPPMLAEGIPVPAGPMGWPELREWLPSLVDDLDPQIQGGAVSALARLVQGTPPRTVREWLGLDASGSAFRAAAALYDAGVVVAPTRRWPTAAGVALIEGSA